MSILLFVGLFVCLVAAVTDVKTGRIPNQLTLPVLALAPPAHVALALYAGATLGAALWQGALSLAGVLLCAVVPLLMWRFNAIGGGDVKLFAALGALALPSLGFEAQLYVLLAASLLAPVKLVYEGKLLGALGNIGVQLTNPFRAKESRRTVDPALLNWFRLGPCFLLGFAAELVIHWRQPW
jgi:prepilin peptidase CpaA